MNRTMIAVSLAFLIMCSAISSAAQANLRGEHDIRIGLLGIGTDGAASFVDLTRKDPDSKMPYLLYLYHSDGLDLKVGSTYQAHVSGENLITWILIKGQRVTPKTMLDGHDISTNACDPKVATNGHWEWLPDQGRAGCKPGSTDPMHWDADAAAKAGKNAKNLPQCITHPGHTNWDIRVEIKVDHAAGKTWTFDDLPAVIANTFLGAMNGNNSHLKFIEPNGENPDFRIYVTLEETNGGTRRDLASASIIGPAEETKGVVQGGVVNFSETSGDAAFTSWHGAIAALAQRVEHRFETGWQNARPCLRADGSVIEQ
jgi:hypothetical protein